MRKTPNNVPRFERPEDRPKPPPAPPSLKLAEACRECPFRTPFDYEELAQKLAPLLKKPETNIIISGDIINHDQFVRDQLIPSLEKVWNDHASDI